MKSITEKLTYPGTTIDQVAAMLADPAFREEVCEAERQQASGQGHDPGAEEPGVLPGDGQAEPASGAAARRRSRCPAP